jgi:hypothetical protein
MSLPEVRRLKLWEFDQLFADLTKRNEQIRRQLETEGGD